MRVVRLSACVLLVLLCVGLSFAQQPVVHSLTNSSLSGLRLLLKEAPRAVVTNNVRLERQRSVVDRSTVFVVPTRHGDSILANPELDVYTGSITGAANAPLVMAYVHGTDSLITFVNGDQGVTTTLPKSCGVTDGSAPPMPPPPVLDPVVLAAKPLLQLDLAVETDVEFYKNTGKDVDKAKAYIAALYAVISSIYEEEIRVTIHLTYVKIWTDDPADPYLAKGDPFKLRDAIGPYWKNNNNTVKRDVFQALTASQWGGGGFGYYDGLCGKNGDFGYSVASVTGTNILPGFGFLYDTYICAHELGHNFNAIHTHDCYWAPPMDTCLTADGIGQGCLPASQKPLPNPGSIMSYCANTNLDAGLGYTLRMTFLPRVIALMRQTAEDAVCLKDPPSATVRLLSPRGQEEFNAGDTTSIRWRASSDVGQIDLAYSINRGASWESIATFVNADEERYLWTIPQVCSNTMLVRVAKSTDAGVADTSIRVFTVRQSTDPTGLVAWYPFNSNTNDSASCGYYPLQGSATYGPNRGGAGGRAATFSGSTTLVAPNFVGDFTTFSASYWFKTVDLTGVQTFLGQNWEEGPTFYTYLWEGSIGAAIYFIDNGAPFQVWGPKLPANTWYHIAITYDGSNAKIYINGGLVTTTPKTGTMAKNTSPLYVGGRKDAERVRGSLDDIRIYRRALTAAEVAAQYAELSVPPNAPQLIEPADATTVAIGPVSFRWSSTPKSTGYRVQVSTDASFSAVAAVIDDATLQAPTLQASALQPATKYYWRAMARNAAGWSGWSPTWSFTTGGVSDVHDVSVVEPIEREEIYDQLGHLVGNALQGSAATGALAQGVYYRVTYRGATSFIQPLIIVR